MRGHEAIKKFRQKKNETKSIRNQCFQLSKIKARSMTVEVMSLTAEEVPLTAEVMSLTAEELPLTVEVVQLTAEETPLTAEVV